MADKKHLEILQQGVEIWNNWRKDNLLIEPDLRSAYLTRANLTDVDLTGVDLTRAYFTSVDLTGVDLTGVDLTRANLYGANLTRANLYGANLSSANLYGANLTRANLTRANLTAADFARANLTRAGLYGVDLSSANLTRANLYGANLARADLTAADLARADLTAADLARANLTRANLYGANLVDAGLLRIQALYANFKNAILTGSCIEDWHINSRTNLQNVKCNYVYIKENKQERIPHDPDKIFAPGEFTKRYQKILETVNLYFGDGIDWQVFLNSFQKLQEEEKVKVQEGKRELSRVQGIENTGDGSFLIKVGVSPDTDKGEYEKSFWQKYQPMLEAKEEQIKFLREEVNIKREELALYRQDKNELMELLKLRANQQINLENKIINQLGNNNMSKDNRETKVEETYNVTNAGIVKNVAPISGNAKIAGVINEAPQKDLSQAAAEIQQLLEQLAKDNPTNTPAEKMMVGVKVAEEIEKDPTLKQRVINVLKAMTVEAFMELIDHPIANVARAAIEAYREPN